MLTLKIEDIKDFMAKLLISDLFHIYRVKEVSITTYNTFHIDGTLQKAFYTTEELESANIQNELLSSWEELKPVCFSLIKGNRSPLKFKFVFTLNREAITSFVSSEGLPFKPEDISGLYLHFLYENSILHCTTGSSMNIFTMDKSLDHVWDQSVQRFFKGSQIPFSIV